MKEFLLPYGKEKLTAKIEDEHLAGVLLSELHSYKAPKSGAELVQDAWSTRSELQDCAIWQLERKKSLLFLLTIQDLFQATL